MVNTQSQVANFLVSPSQHLNILKQPVSDPVNNKHQLKSCISEAHAISPQDIFLFIGNSSGRGIPKKLGILLLFSYLDESIMDSEPQEPSPFQKILC